MDGKRATEKVKTSFQVSPEGKRLLVAVAARLGVSQSAAFELAIRHLAKREKVDP